MNLTRNTKLFRAYSESGKTAIYKTLSISELSVIEKIESIYHKNEFAYQIGKVSGDDMNFFEEQQIGKQIINSSLILFENQNLFELTIDEFRETLDNDAVFTLISNIIGIMPNVSIEYLLSLTYEDIIELTVFCEKISNKVIFNTTASTAPTQRLNPTPEIVEEGKTFFQDDGKSLQEKMKESEKF